MQSQEQYGHKLALGIFDTYKASHNQSYPLVCHAVSFITSDTVSGIADEFLMPTKAIDSNRRQEEVVRMYSS